MGSDLGADLRSAEVLVVGRPSTTREKDSIASKSVLSLYTSAFTTPGLSARNRLTRALKRERSAFTITNNLAIVLKVIP